MNAHVMPPALIPACPPDFIAANAAAIWWPVARPARRLPNPWQVLTDADFADVIGGAS